MLFIIKKIFLQHINKLSDETNLLKSWITDTESKVTRPITFADSSEETLKKELQRLEVSILIT